MRNHKYCTSEFSDRPLNESTVSVWVKQCITDKEVELRETTGRGKGSDRAVIAVGNQ